MSINNRQAQRTRRLLQDALNTLIREKPYETIEISEITERANTARVTFYRHYGSKDELLLDFLAHLYEQLRGVVEGVAFENVLDMQQEPPVLPLFRLIERDRDLFRRLVLSPAGALIAQRVRHYLVEQIMRTFQQSPSYEGIPLEIFANHVASCTIGNLTWWLLEADYYSAGYMARMTHWMSVSGVMAVLGRLSEIRLPDPDAWRDLRD